MRFNAFSIWPENRVIIGVNASVVAENRVIIGVCASTRLYPAQFVFNLAPKPCIYWCERISGGLKPCNYWCERISGGLKPCNYWGMRDYPAQSGSIRFPFGPKTVYLLV